MPFRPGSRSRPMLLRMNYSRERMTQGRKAGIDSDRAATLVIHRRTTFSFMRADRRLQPCIESARMRKSVLHLFKLISPSNVPSPVAVPAAKSIVSIWIIVNVPVARANRPVPFSIVATFVSLAVFGGMKTP
jgi:hypothetical protein